MISKNRISLIDLNLQSPDIERIKILSSKLDLKLVDESNFFENNKEIDTLLVSDISPNNILKEILKKNKEKKINKIYLLNLELYSINLFSLISDHYVRNILFNLKQKNFYKILKSLIILLMRFEKLYLVNKILKSTNVVLLVPSIPRMNYIEKKVLSEKVLIKNMPLRIDIIQCLKSKPIIDENLIFDKYAYIYLSGNINNYNEFIKICEFAKSLKLKFVVSTNNLIPNKITNEFSKTLVTTGMISNQKVLQLVKNCRSAVALYDKRIKNLELCASSKLFEYMCLGKHIIASEVEGISHEFKFYRYKNFTYVNQIYKEKLVEENIINDDIADKRFFYEEQLNNIKLD